MSKRSNYISWDEYFMGICLLSAQRSKDPNTQVGCCLVDENNHIISIGYNGFPNGCSDNIVSWSKENKYNYVVHAEANAILNRNILKLPNCKAYVTLFPCHECTKLLIQIGVTEVIYATDKLDEASKYMFDLVGIKYRKYISKGKTIEINI
jgi:dCMP deaminase